MLIKEIKIDKPYKRMKKIGSGANAICYLNENKEVFKLYRDYRCVKQAISSPKFFEKIIKIANLANDSYIGPKEIIVKDGVILGYVCTYIKAKPLRKIRKRERIYDIFKNYDALIEDTKEISIKNFRLGDVHDQNILYRNGTFNLIDLDNGYFKNNEDETVEDVTRQNIGRIFNEALKKIFNIRTHEIPFFMDKELEKIIYKIDPTNIDEVYKLCEYLANVCNDKNPTLSKIRKKVKITKEKDGYIYRFF